MASAGAAIGGLVGGIPRGVVPLNIFFDSIVARLENKTGKPISKRSKEAVAARAQAQPAPVQQQQAAQPAPVAQPTQAAPVTPGVTSTSTGLGGEARKRKPSAKGRRRNILTAPTGISPITTLLGG